MDGCDGFGGETTLLMSSISLDLNISIEGAHVIFTGKMLRDPNSMGYKGVKIWTGMSIYDDFSEHGLEAHNRWVGSSWLAGCEV